MGDSKKIISDFEHEVSKAHGEANLCLKALELFINQNPELDIICQQLPDGSTMLKIVEREYSEPPKGKI